MVQSIFTDGREFPAENFAQGYTLLISHGDSAVIRTCILGADELYREGGVGEGAGTRIRGRWMEGRGRGGGMIRCHQATIGSEPTKQFSPLPEHEMEPAERGRFQGK